MNPKQIIQELHNNLTQQQQAMVADDLAIIQTLTGEQQELIDKLNKFLAQVDPGEITREIQDGLRQIHSLFEINQMLARQSLDFSRRVLESLGGKSGYRSDGTSEVKGENRFKIRA